MTYESVSGVYRSSLCERKLRDGRRAAANERGPPTCSHPSRTVVVIFESVVDPVSVLILALEYYGLHHQCVPVKIARFVSLNRLLLERTGLGQRRSCHVYHKREEVSSSEQRRRRSKRGKAMRMQTAVADRVSCVRRGGMRDNEEEDEPIVGDIVSTR